MYTVFIILETEVERTSLIMGSNERNLYILFLSLSKSRCIQTLSSFAVFCNFVFSPTCILMKQILPF